MFDLEFAEKFNQQLKASGWTQSRLVRGSTSNPYQIERYDGVSCSAANGRQFPLQGTAYKSKKSLMDFAEEYLNSINA